MLVFAVAAVKLGPGLGSRSATASSRTSHRTTRSLYLYFAVGLLGAAMTPYEVYFYSSGGVEEGWTPKDLGINRANAIIGYGLGGSLSFALMIVGGDALPRPRHRARDPRHDRARRRRSRSARSACCSPSSASSSPSAAPRSTPSSPAPTTSPSSGLGVGPLPPPTGRPALHAHLVRAARARARDRHDRRRPGAC